MTQEPSSHGTDYRAAIYGSIVVAALLGALEAEHAEPAQVTGSLLATTVVFWLAHVWAGVVGERIRVGHGYEWRRVRRVATEEWPLVEAGFVPLIPVVLAWVGPGTRTTGANAALTLALLQLGAWGLFAGRRAHDGWTIAIASGVVTALLGLGVVLLEIHLH